ncbi:Uncharacterised protein [Mycobacteroides abscessus subsp. abscessus]|nr:Uncharacterised protein [Mycobacteroides abscessus subsp. abscessus]
MSAANEVRADPVLPVVISAVAALVPQAVRVALVPQVAVRAVLVPQVATVALVPQVAVVTSVLLTQVRADPVPQVTTHLVLQMQGAAETVLHLT